MAANVAAEINLGDDSSFDFVIDIIDIVIVNLGEDSSFDYKIIKLMFSGEKGETISAA